MEGSLDRRTFLATLAAGAATLAAGSVIIHGSAQPASPGASPVPVATLPEPTADGIDVPVLGIAFGSNEIVATPEVAAGTVRLLTAVPYEDFGSVIFRIPDDQPDAIEQIWAAFAQPEPAFPDWVFEMYLPGGVRTDFRHGRARRVIVSLSRADGVRLVIEDDGMGLPPGYVSGVGVFSMRERAEELGGSFAIGPAEPRGTHIEVTIPIPEAPP